MNKEYKRIVDIPSKRLITDAIIIRASIPIEVECDGNKKTIQINPDQMTKCKNAENYWTVSGNLHESETKFKAPIRFDEEVGWIKFSKDIEASA